MASEKVEATEQEKVFEFTSVSSVINQTLTDLEYILEPNPASKFIGTGFREIDKAVKGFEKGKLCTIGLRPGLGKTAFMLSMSFNMAVNCKSKVAIFSLERTAEKIVHRMIESETGYSFNKIVQKKLDKIERDHALSLIHNIISANILIDDDQYLTIDEIEEKVHYLVAKGISDVIFVDYLELLSASIMDPEMRNTESANIVARLSELAHETGIPIVCFSQVSGVQSQSTYSKNPIFRYTPDYINKHTDALFFVNRPDYYHINEIDQKEQGVAEVTIAKHTKISEPKIIPLRFIEAIDKYIDY